LDYLGEPWEAMRGVSAKFHWEANNEKTF